MSETGRGTISALLWGGETFLLYFHFVGWGAPTTFRVSWQNFNGNSFSCDFLLRMETFHIRVFCIFVSFIHQGSSVFQRHKCGHNAEIHTIHTILEELQVTVLREKRTMCWPCMLNELKVNFLAIVTKEEIAAILNIRSYTYLGCHLGWMFVLLLWVTDDQLLFFITCRSFPAPTVKVSKFWSSAAFVT